MGYMRHHVIVVCSELWPIIDKAHAEAKRIFPAVSEILEAEINGLRSFFVPPDASKEGWEESDLGDERRDEFVSWLQKQVYGDNSSPLDWVEVRMSDDNGDVCIERSTPLTQDE